MGEIKKAVVESINEEHRACESAARSAVVHAIRAGELLVETKSEVAHGSWGGWLQDNFAGSERTAQTYMKLCRDQDRLNPQHVADLSIRGALAELDSAPEEAVEDLVLEPDGMEPGDCSSVRVYLFRDMIEEGRTKEAANKFDLTEDQVRWWVNRSLSTEQVSADVAAVRRYGLWCLKNGTEPDETEMADRTERDIKPVDLSPSMVRDHYEEHLTYKDMHRTFGELVKEKRLLPSVADQPLRDQLLQSAIFGADLSLPDGGTDEEIAGIYLAMWRYANGGGHRSDEGLINAGIDRSEEIRKESYPAEEKPEGGRFGHSSQVNVSARQELRFRLARATTMRTAGWLWEGFDAWKALRTSGEEE